MFLELSSCLLIILLIDIFHKDFSIYGEKTLLSFDQTKIRYKKNFLLFNSNTTIESL